MLYQLRGKKKTFEVGSPVEIQMDGAWVRGTVTRATAFHVVATLENNAAESVSVAMLIYSARNKLCFVDIRGVEA